VILLGGEVGSHAGLLKEVNALLAGSEFGVIKIYPTDTSDRNIRSLWGLVGEKSLVIVNQENNGLEFLRIKHVLLATVMVEFFPDPDGHIEILVYGGRQARNHLWDALARNFGVSPSPFQRYFDPSAVRKLCETYFDSLYEINIAPDNQDGWETISLADFKSYTGRFILPKAKRMQQVRENKDIRIMAFESILDAQILMPPMLRACDVRFKLLKDSGVTISTPPLELPSFLSDLEVESTFYDFVRQTYSRIIGDKDLYATTKNYPLQFSLFDEP